MGGASHGRVTKRSRVGRRLERTGWLVVGIIGNLVSGDTLDRIKAHPDSAPQAWAVVFGITAIVAVLGALIFACLASADQIDFDAHAASEILHEG